MNIDRCGYCRKSNLKLRIPTAEQLGRFSKRRSFLPGTKFCVSCCVLASKSVIKSAQINSRQQITASEPSFSSFDSDLSAIMSLAASNQWFRTANKENEGSVTESSDNNNTDHSNADQSNTDQNRDISLSLNISKRRREEETGGQPESEPLGRPVRMIPADRPGPKSRKIQTAGANRQLVSPNMSETSSVLSSGPVSSADSYDQLVSRPQKGIRTRPRRTQQLAPEYESFTAPRAISPRLREGSPTDIVRARQRTQNSFQQNSANSADEGLLVQNEESIRRSARTSVQQSDSSGDEDLIGQRLILNDALRAEREAAYGTWRPHSG